MLFPAWHPPISSFASLHGVWAAKPLFYWLEREFVMSAVFVKKPPPYAGQRHGLPKAPFLGPRLQRVQRVSRKCPRSVRNTFLTLWGLPGPFFGHFGAPDGHPVRQSLEHPRFRGHSLGHSGPREPVAGRQNRTSWPQTATILANDPLVASWLLFVWGWHTNLVATFAAAAYKLRDWTHKSQVFCCTRNAALSFHLLGTSISSLTALKCWWAFVSKGRFGMFHRAFASHAPHPYPKRVRIPAT